MKKVILIAFSFITIIKANVTVAQVNVQDSLALVDLYNTTDGAHWTKNTNWLTVAPVGSWYGITVDSSRVTWISLDLNNLTGYLPSSIGNITHLEELLLAEQQLNDSIPTSIGNLVRLKDIDLDENNLTGVIPTSLGNLVNLQTLDLEFNQLTGNIPSSLGNLQELTYLDVSANSLSDTIPSSLGNLIKLERLYFLENNLTGKIPSSFGNFSKLTIVYFSDNHLSDSIPATLENLQAEIYLDDNNFTYSGMEGFVKKFPNTIYAPQAKIALHEHTSKLAVSVGGTLSNETFSWYRNNVLDKVNTGDSTYAIKSSGSYMVNVSNSIATKLVLTSDTIILTDRMVDSLALIDLYNNTNGSGWSKNSNWLTSAPINSWYGVSMMNDRVDSLNLSFNNLNGYLPVSIGNLTKLRYLNFTSNAISDTIPSSVGSLTNLFYFSLAANNLKGTIPFSFGNLVNLDTIYLGGNKIGGTIPSSFYKLKKLRYINFNLDSLHGVIPAFIGSFSDLSYLGLGGNYLSGQIPDTLGNLINLKYLVLYSNQLTGKIPLTIGTLTNLIFLNLYNNHLSDSVPASLENLTNLTSPDISINDFTFSGMEGFAQKFPSSNYYPQATINLKKADSILYVSVGGTVAYNTYKWYRNDTLVATISADSTYKPLIDGNYFVQVTNAIAIRLTLSSDTIAYHVDTAILITSPRLEYANRQEEGSDGWTNYYYDNNTPANYSDDTLLLSLKRNGQNIGNIGDTGFTVKLVATAAAGSNSAIKLTNPLITNPTGFWVMNRYWQVTPTHEPTSSIGVRFYYNKQDLNDVNGSYPGHNLKNHQLIFYKTIGGNPDPTTNLEGATQIISILPAIYPSDTTWTYHQLTDTTQYAEFSVKSFSGGGGGGTGNDQTLPINLISFNANKQTGKIIFQWFVPAPDNSNYFELQRSVNGISYETIQTVYSINSHAPVNIYTGIDDNLPSGKIQYRLKIVGKEGEIQYSKIINIDNISKFVMSVNPNPVHNEINIKIHSPQPLKARIQIFDIKGRQVLEKQSELISGNNLIKIDSRNLAQGIYLIKLIGNGTLTSLNCIKE